MISNGHCRYKLTKWVRAPHPFFAPITVSHSVNIAVAVVVFRVLALARVLFEAALAFSAF